MPHWADALSPQGRADMQALVDAAIAAGRAALAGAAVFTPIPVILATNNQIVPLTADQLIPPGTPADRQAALAIGALHKVAGAARAVALVTVARLSGGFVSGTSDAMQVWAEHAEGAAITLVQPYRRAVVGGVIEFDPLQTYPGERRIWA